MADVRDILESNGYTIHLESGDYLKMRPLYRESSNNTALSVNKNTGYWVDWVTMEKGDLKSLISKTGGDSNISLEVSKKNKNKQLLDFSIKLNSEDIPTLLPNYNFYLNRGISEDTLRELRSGMCTSGKMNSRYVFPIFSESNDIIGLAGRDLLKSDVRPKWKKLGESKKFAYPLFTNKEDILNKRQVILLEGISDLVALFDCGIRQCLVVFGLNLSSFLLSKILELQPTDIVLGFNFDDKNDGSNPGMLGNIKIRDKLLKWFSPSVVRICLPYKNDFGDMSKDEILDWAHKNNIKL